MASDHPKDVINFAPGRLKKPMTFNYLYEKATPPIVEKFVSKYNENASMAVAKRAHDLLKEKLGPPTKHPTDEGVQAMLKWRAKSKDSLREKLKMWNEETAFSTTEQIKNEVKDLAGVRIILYIPSRSQYDRVGEIIRHTFQPANVHKHVPRKRTQGGNEPTTYKPIHLGYQGEHYWVSMKDVAPTEKYKYMEGEQVEIQVTSALGNAWAEAQHDVLYKSNNYGPATLQEQQIFDAVNGLVLSSDLLLQQAHDLLMGRTFAKLEDTWELESFLKKLDVLQSTESTVIPELSELISTDHTKMILNLLKKTGKNHPLAVREIVKGLGYPNNTRLPEILDEFRPSFQPAPKMDIVVCLAHTLVSDVKDIETLRMRAEGSALVPLKDMSPCDRCCILVNAMTLLQDILGHQRDRVRNYLLDQVKLDDATRDSLDWVVTDPGRRLMLQKAVNDHTHDQRRIEEHIREGWKWFEKQAQNSYSICGLAFKLAAIGATKPFEFEFLSKVKDIGSLSRRSTTNEDNDMDKDKDRT